jgi:hypothetical protein
MEDLSKLQENRLPVPVSLNFPVVVAETPYMLLVHDRSYWTPRGMTLETWRALSFPLIGAFFWWLLGRGIEALRTVQQGIISPQIGWIETIWSAILVCIGVVMAVGVLTSTPADRADRQFVTLLAGGCLWGALSVVTVVARWLQCRVRRSDAGQSSVGANQIPTRS